MKKCTSFEEQKGTRYIQGNVYLDVIVFSCLSSTKLCLRFLLICLAQEIKGFYQSSLRNDVDFRNIMNISSNILAKNFKKLGTTVKTLYLFSYKRKDLKTHFLILILNYRKISQKKNHVIQNNNKLAIQWCVMLFIHCLFWFKNWRFQQIFVRVYYILKLKERFNLLVHERFILCNKDRFFYQMFEFV